MKHFLVTGAAGFIGSVLSARLVRDGHQVTIIDDLSTGKTGNIPDRCEFIQMELGADDLKVLHGRTFDAVFHLAGQSSGEASFLDPEKDFRSHVTSTFDLLKWCKENSVDRFIYASSMSVYGDPVTLPVSEKADIQPKTYYAAGKAAAENYIRLFQTLGLNTTILRFFNVYGPGQNLDNMRQGMASIYLAYMLKGDTVQIKGSKDRFRDFLYIDDLVDAWLKVYENPVTWGQTYNLCAGEKTTVETLINQLRDAFGEAAYPIEYLEGTPGDQFGLYGDNAKICKDIGWTPQVNLQQGLRKMVERTRQGANIG